MRWGGDDVGVVLSRGEVWLLLNALASAPTPAVDRDGLELEPWVVGELKARLQAAMRPDPVSDIEERPIVRLDSDMGRSLAAAGVRSMAIEGGYDLGSLIEACSARGWGVELRLPAGSVPSTPMEAVVIVGGESGRRAFVGLERPVVALARALIAALGSDESGDVHKASKGDGLAGERDFEEYVIRADAINPGERDSTITAMAGEGWELVVDDGEGLVFRRMGDGK